MRKIIVIIGCICTILLVYACDRNTKSTTEETTTTVITTTTTEEQLPDIPPSLDMCDDLPDQGDYKIAWCDEFNYQGLPDDTKWQYDVGGNGWGNNEVQYYTRADRDNVVVKNDNLIITARKESFGGRNYTSTRLNSAGKSEFLYGKIDIRAKLPGEKGTWPALWMLGNFEKYGWPGCGEVDIMEHVGNDLNRVHGSIHTKNYNHKEGTQKTASLYVQDVVNNYHIYSIEWTPKQIRFFIDGLNYFVFNNDEINNPNNSHDSWPFDEKMFFILNIALGGWGGTVPSSFTEAKMYVDYVRVYQKEFPENDTVAPDKVENLKMNLKLKNSASFIWDAANDDLGVKYYEIYAKNKTTNEEELLGTSNLPKFVVTGLNESTSYEIKVIAVDFENNKSEPASIDYTTDENQAVTEKIQAEEYATMSGIDIEDTVDTDGGKNVGWMDAGDYLTYQLNVYEPGNYYINYRVAVNTSGAKYELYCDDKLLATTQFNSTGGWQNWNTVVSNEFQLEKGSYLFKIKVTVPGSNLNWFQFIKSE